MLLCRCEDVVLYAWLAVCSAVNVSILAFLHAHSVSTIRYSHAPKSCHSLAIVVVGALVGFVYLAFLLWRPNELFSNMFMKMSIKSPLSMRPTFEVLFGRRFPVTSTFFVPRRPMA
jgi:hypothetical protein